MLNGLKARLVNDLKNSGEAGILPTTLLRMVCRSYEAERFAGLKNIESAEISVRMLQQGTRFKSPRARGVWIVSIRRGLVGRRVLVSTRRCNLVDVLLYRLWYFH
jgi:hypothetical protein